MAQQTINVGTAPNDGTGTPLRTAFQYTNSNFSELYTAVGPSGNNIVVPGNATITGDLTVDTSTLKVDSTNNRVGVLNTPTVPFEVTGLIASSNGAFQAGASNSIFAGLNNDGTNPGLDLRRWTGTANNHGAAYIATSSSGDALFYTDSVASNTRATTLRMTLNSTGLGVGGTPSGNTPTILCEGIAGTYAKFNSKVGTKTWSAGYRSGTLQYEIQEDGTERFVIANGGNVGIGVTPSAWWTGFKAVESSNGVALLAQTNVPYCHLVSNAYDGATNFKYKVSSNYALRYAQDATTGNHIWFNAGLGTAGNNITFTQAMTLDSGGNLLVGTTSGTSHNLRKQGTTVEGDTHLNVGNAEHLFFACSSVTYNAAAAAYKITRNSSTLRSINAGGTINASGADYAEYMTKASDFVLSKGGIAGIDANGKLTNVFADAVSFVVKSTDPSYVGNDKWGNDLEGDELEAARQLVDRIAFAGQVPVNVTGAKAGDYIVPVVDGTGIKGIAVSNPTFEQYQLAVGKVIAIDADGRARIIVKVA